MTDQDPTRIEQAVDPTSVFAPEGAGGPPTRALPPTPGPPPPDRRPWIIAAVLALIVIMLILLLVLQGDDDDGDVATSSTTTTAQVTSTSSSSSTSTSTSTTAAPTTTVKPVVTVPPDECAEAGGGPAKPGLAAEAVYDAWVRGDEACAAELMTAPALTELFSRDGEGADHTFQGCMEEDVPDPHVDCAYSYDGGATHYLMNFSDTEGWQVYDITQFAD